MDKTIPDFEVERKKAFDEAVAHLPGIEDSPKLMQVAGFFFGRGTLFALQLAATATEAIKAERKAEFPDIIDG